MLLVRLKPDDLAKRIQEGRFGPQKLKMLYCKRKFNLHTLIFLVEGDLQSYVVTGCACGFCEGVGRCGAPTVQKIEEVLLETKEAGFSVIKTGNLTESMDILVSITAWLKIAAEDASCDFSVGFFAFISKLIYC